MKKKFEDWLILINNESQSDREIEMIDDWDEERNKYINQPPNLPQAGAPQSRSVNPLLADVLAEIDDKVGSGYGFNNWKDAVVKVLSKYFS